MGGVYTIYSYFNSEQIQGVLNAIVMLVGSGGTDGDYLSIVRVAAMLGLFLAVTYGFVKARGEDAGYYLLMVAIFYSTLFVPRVTVTIEERGGAGGGAPLVVANVPIGLAFFASTTSHIGSWLTERTETFFSLPSDELKLQKNGLMGGSRALRNLQSASFQDPILAQDLKVFMRECVNPELLVSPSYVETLLKSNSIWTEIGPAGLNLINPGRMVSLIGEAGAISCSEAYTNTTPRINAQATKEHGRIATLISPSATPTTADAILTALIPAQESLIMTASASTADAIKQRMMINMLNDAPSGIASMMNDPAAAQIALGASAATSSANTAYAVMAKLAQETLPVIRNAIELVIIGVFPIILLLIIIAGSKGGIVLRSYVMTMLWVQLWAPLYAIVNYVGVMAASKSMKAALAGVDGVCVMNAAQLLNSTISAEGIAGMLTISVPMIALALVKGGEVAMSGVTSGLSAPSNSAASSVGSQIGMGNVSMGNTSWGTHSSNTSTMNKINHGTELTGADVGTHRTPFGTYNHAPNGEGYIQTSMANAGVTASSELGKDASNKSFSGKGGSLADRKDAGITRNSGTDYSSSDLASASALLSNFLQNQYGNVDTGIKQAISQLAAGHSGIIQLGDGNTINAVAGFNSQAVGGLRSPGAPSPGTTHEGTNPQITPQNQTPGSPITSQPSTAPGLPPPPAQTTAPTTAPTSGQQGGGFLSELRRSIPIYGSIQAGGGGSINSGSQRTSSQYDSAQHSANELDSFARASQAANSIIGGNLKSGQRNAMRAIMNKLAENVSSQTGTAVTFTETDTAGQETGNGNRYAKSVATNDNYNASKIAIDMAGGNYSEAMRLMATNQGFRDKVASETARRASASFNPKTMEGEAIQAPATLDEIRTKGNTAIAEKDSEGKAEVIAANKEGRGKQEAERNRLGAPKAESMPDTSEAKERANKTFKDVDKGLKDVGMKRAISSGANVNANAFLAREGPISIVKQTSPNMVKEAIIEEAGRNPEFAQRVINSGNTGRADPVVVEFARKTMRSRGEIMIDELKDNSNK